MNIISEARGYLKKQGWPRKEIDKAIESMQTTCVACKHSRDCRARGIVSEPYHPKCERHEFVDRLIK